MNASMPVLQFLALARGDWPVQKPNNKKKVQAITTTRGMCLGCCAVVHKDNIFFEDGDQVSICWACERTVLNGVVIPREGWH